MKGIGTTLSLSLSLPLSLPPFFSSNSLSLSLSLSLFHTEVSSHTKVAMASGFGVFDLISFVCPITTAIFDEPMLADDGRTYSTGAILGWFGSCRSRQLPITSPCTRKPISERLVPNADIAESIHEYRKTRKGGLSASAPAMDATLAPKSLAELGAVFSLLDGMRQLLAETLDG